MTESKWSRSIRTDFIAWLKDDTGQHVLFLDPKGLGTNTVDVLAAPNGNVAQLGFFRSEMLVTTVEVIRLSRPPMRMSMGIRIDGQLAMARNVGTM